MSLYVDSSAVVKRYVDEPDSALAIDLIESDANVLTGRHTIVEVRRNLARQLKEQDARRAKATFSRHLASITLVELDVATCELAASIGENIGIRSLDAFHLAAAKRAGDTQLTFLTFDHRQAQAARTLGFTVIGV